MIYKIVAKHLELEKYEWTYDYEVDGNNLPHFLKYLEDNNLLLIGARIIDKRRRK